MNNIILIELNEVPNSVLDEYASKSAFFSEFLKSSDRYTTYCEDQIQLDPWIAWPTMHRGVPDLKHGLLRLGQDTDVVDGEYPPIWRRLADEGVSVGVYGSIYASSEKDHSGYSFFVPDVFSPHDNVKPESLSNFQKFNLDMTRASARNADKGVAAGGATTIGKLALDGVLRPSTLARLGTQVLEEQFNSQVVSRRRNFQAEIAGDVFCALLRENRPQFATLYSNNVAAAMHRFWSASFSDTSINTGRLTKEWLSTYSDEIFIALKSVERILRYLLAKSGADTTIVIASAIGQEEIPAENHTQFVGVANPETFITMLMGEHSHGKMTIRPTMVPDLTISFEDPRDAARLCERLKTLSIDSINAVETLERMTSKNKLNIDGQYDILLYQYDNSSEFKLPITFARSNDNTVHVSLQLDDYSGPPVARLGNQEYAFAQLGLGFVPHDEGVNCTAQHCAEGSLTVHRPAKNGSGTMGKVSTLDFVPSLLKHFDCPIPANLPGQASIRF